MAVADHHPPVGHAASLAPFRRPECAEPRPQHRVVHARMHRVGPDRRPAAERRSPRRPPGRPAGNGWSPWRRRTPGPSGCRGARTSAGGGCARKPSTGMNSSRTAVVIQAVRDCAMPSMKAHRPNQTQLNALSLPPRSSSSRENTTTAPSCGRAGSCGRMSRANCRTARRDGSSVQDTG